MVLLFELAKNLEQQMADKDTTEPAEEVTVCDDRDDECDELDGGGESEGEGDTEYEDETDMTTETETETESEEEIGKSNRMSMTGTNLRTEPKFIVFLSQLLLLFKVCHVCKTDNPELETKQVGTEAVVTTSCSNPKCPKQVNTWHSQPTMPNSQIPAGNFLLCMAVLLAGSSATKVFQVFKHMGLCCVSLNTYFRYQRSKMFPTILIFWESYQAKLLAKVKAIREGVSMAGDGRHDSMGHSAKFGAYTMFCCTIPMIIHFVLIQRNQAGNSPAMEFMGFKECINFLLGYGIVITSFISDRHLSIACHMRKVLTGITHYFDIWHLKKKIRKVLSKISKLKGCEVISEWIKPCENHLYWSAASTYSGNGLVIYAKFKTFLSHIIDKHSSLPDALFNKCGHGVLRPRKWLTAGSVAYEKLCSALTNNSLVKGIKQASPFAQTSCLEGFHSLLNQFAPKMIAYSYVGMYCRHILAVVHFNMNLQRETKKKDVDGVERVKVSYPKFKNGEATVRNARIEQNFDYVEEIFQTYLMASKDDIGDATNKLKEMTPAPMNSMLEKQPRGEAVEKREKRRSMVVADIPPTTPVSQPTASTSTTASSSKPKKRSRTDTPSSASQPKKKRAKAPSSARRPKEKPANTRTTSTANRPKKKPANTRTTSTANRPKKKPRTDAPSSTQRPGKRSQRKPSTPSRPGKRSRKQ